MSNLSRRAFLSSLGIAAAAPSVVGKAIEGAGLNSLTNRFWSVSIDTETIDYRNDGYWGSSACPWGYLILTSESGEVKSAPLLSTSPFSDDKINESISQLLSNG